MTGRPCGPVSLGPVLQIGLACKVWPGRLPRISIGQLAQTSEQACRCR